MKKNLFFSLFLMLAVTFVSCKDDEYQVITFENVTLTDSIWNGSDGSAKYSVDGLDFKNTYTKSAWGDYWSGFAFSSKNDVTTEGYMNQYSVIAGEGAAKSEKFALIYGDGEVTVSTNVLLKSVMITNSTYAYLDMMNGSTYGKKFAADDWYKVTITGYMGEVKTAAVDYYLADFRNGKTVISKTWNKVDISSLGKVDKVVFSFDSSDQGAFGMNTPAYACIDNIEFEDVTESK